MATRMKLRTLPLFPLGNASRLLNLSQDRNFWSEANVFILVSRAIKMWAWIPEEIKHKGRKQEEIEGEVSEAREEMMTHQLPIKSFLGCWGSGAWGKASAETGRTEPQEWAEGRALQWEAVINVCSLLGVLRVDLIK